MKYSYVSPNSVIIFWRYLEVIGYTKCISAFGWMWTSLYLLLFYLITGYFKYLSFIMGHHFKDSYTYVLEFFWKQNTIRTIFAPLPCQCWYDCQPLRKYIFLIPIARKCETKEFCATVFQISWYDTFKKIVNCKKRKQK